MATTFLAPIALRFLLEPKGGPPAGDQQSGTADLVSRV